MNTTKGIFSRRSDEWATPQEFFDVVDAEFHFTLDPCATPENAKCRVYYTAEEDGLLQAWGGIPCGAILHTPGVSTGAGRLWRSPSEVLPWSCSYRPGRTRSGSTSMFWGGQRSASSEGGSSSTGRRTRHSRHCWRSIKEEGKKCGPVGKTGKKCVLSVRS